MIEILVVLSWLVLLILLAGAVFLAWYAHGPERQLLILIPAAAVLVAIALALLGVLQLAPWPILNLLFGLGLVLLGVVGGSPAVALVLRLASTSATPGEHGGILVDDGARTKKREILRGGRTIGYLERLAYIVCIFAGQFAGIAVIVAIKGLGRYSELENAEARERFLIGSLTSLIWAAAAAAPFALLQWGVIAYSPLP